MSSLKFSLVGKVTPVELESASGVEQYELREVSAADRDCYLNKMAKRLQYGPDGKVGNIGNFLGAQADLLTLCLHDDKGVPVTEKTVQGWPAVVVSNLFDAARKLNGLDNEEALDENAAKKD
jgi:hypothetical protein